MKFLACCVLPDKKLYGNCLYCLNILYWNIFHLSLRNRVAVKFSTVLNIFFTTQDFWATWDCPEKQSLPWIFLLCWIYIFYHSGFLSNLRLPWKTEFTLNIFIVLKYFLSFRFFEQLALALRNRVSLKILTVLNIHFLSFRVSEQLTLDLKNRVALKFSLYWIYIFYHWGFLSNLRLPWKSLPCIFTASVFFKEYVRYPIWICRDPISLILGTRIGSLKRFKKTCCIEYIFFIIQDFLATCACPEKTVALKIFTVMNIYFLSFKIFEQLALALKTELPWIFSLYWIYIFYDSGFLSNLHMPCKQSLPWIHCIEYIFFIIQDVWTTCACPEFLKTGRAAAFPDPPPRRPMAMSLNETPPWKFSARATVCER